MLYGRLNETFTAATLLLLLNVYNDLPPAAGPGQLL